MALDVVFASRLAAVGQCHAHGAVVRVVIGFGLQAASFLAVSAEVAEALGGRIIRFDVASEGVDERPAADNRHFSVRTAVPHHARALGLNRAAERVAEGVGINVAFLGVVDGVCLVFGREVFIFDCKRLSALYLIRRTDGGKPSHLVVAVLHRLAVHVDCHCGSVPKRVVGRGRRVAVGLHVGQHDKDCAYPYHDQADVFLCDLHKPTKLRNGIFRR